MVRVTLAVTLFASVALAAPVPKDFAKPPALAGSWRMDSCDTGNGPSTNYPGVTWAFTADRVEFRTPTSGGTSSAGLAVDPQAKPGQFVMQLNGGTHRAGLYRIDGDRMTLSLSLSAKPPANLEPGTGTYLYQFTRIK